MANLTWDQFFINLAKETSKKSKDKSTKVGAVIVGQDNEVLSIGFNGLPRGVDDNNEKYHERPLKYSVVSHAEVNCIYNAARQGIKLYGARLYINYTPYCVCCECAKAIIQSGIRQVIGPNLDFPGVGGHWKSNLQISSSLLKEVGVRMVVDGV